MIGKPDYQKVKREVDKIIQKFGILKPPIDPIIIAKNCDVKVVFAKFRADIEKQVSGFYDAKQNTIFVNQEEYPLRQTFTIAHELGHSLLHKEWAASNDYQILLRDNLAPSDNLQEKEANAFAAHLLVPRFMLDKYWKFATIEQLSEIFVVSVLVIKNRIAFEYGVYDA